MVVGGERVRDVFVCGAAVGICVRARREFLCGFGYEAVGST